MTWKPKLTKAAAAPTTPKGGDKAMTAITQAMREAGAEAIRDAKRRLPKLADSEMWLACQVYRAMEHASLHRRRPPPDSVEAMGPTAATRDPDGVEP